MSDAKPTRHAVELAVLSVLSAGPSYGYAITKEVAARSGGELAAPPGVLYPLLRGMAKDGLVTATWETVRAQRPAADPDATEGRRRKWYRLSAKGRRRLDQQIAAHRAWTAMIERLIAPREEEAS